MDARWRTEFVETYSDDNIESGNEEIWIGASLGETQRVRQDGGNARREHEQHARRVRDVVDQPAGGLHSWKMWYLKNKNRKKVLKIGQSMNEDILVWKFSAVITTWNISSDESQRKRSIANLQRWARFDPDAHSRLRRQWGLWPAMRSLSCELDDRRSRPAELRDDTLVCKYYVDFFQNTNKNYCKSQVLVAARLLCRKMYNEPKISTNAQETEIFEICFEKKKSKNKPNNFRFLKTLLK